MQNLNETLFSVAFVVAVSFVFTVALGWLLIPALRAGEKLENLQAGGLGDHLSGGSGSA